MTDNLSMALISDFRFRWQANSDMVIGFAEIHDMRLGDMLIGSKVDKQMYLDNAWIEIEAVLGRRYKTPLTSDVPQATSSQLKHIHSLLASAWLLQELNAGNNVDQASFATWLHDEAHRRLAMIAEGTLDLDGIPLRIDPEKFDEVTGHATNVPTILTKDSVSPFDSFSDFAHQGYTTAIPVPYEPGSGMTPRPVA